MTRKGNTWIVPGTVVRVVDGDTLQADLDLGWNVRMSKATIRVADINCPELDTDAGKAAAARTAQLLPAGTPIMVVSHSRDKYGRVLATVIVGNQSLASTLTKEGHAQPFMVDHLDDAPPDLLTEN